mmetsp:Transcript_9667/g.15976  ORF Transcript_9667/g.15976 Transcript_9667/m.15976 type:complete len:856 (+) Transcript_9667:262-2829(+)
MFKLKISDSTNVGSNSFLGLSSPKAGFDSPSGTSPKPRKKDIRKQILNRFNMWLLFRDKRDDNLYHESLMESFYLPTFVPLVLLLVVFGFLSRSGANDIYSKIGDGWIILTIQVILAWGFVLLLVLFALAQAIDYYIDASKESSILVRMSDYMLKSFCYGKIGDCLVILFALSQGLQFQVITGGNLCVSCGNFFDVETCDEHNHRYFPFHHVFFSYTVLLLLPIFLKSTNRHVCILSTVLFTVFMIIAIVVGGYAYSHQMVFSALVFLLTQFEFERTRMASFLLGKEALNVEKMQQEKTQADAHMQLERRMNQALLQQILPPQVAKQLLSGKKVAPEEFEEVTIFFSDVVGFTNICAQVTPIEVVKMLNELYTVMDYCTSHFPLYKVETIGDAYMLVGGLPTRDAKHAEQIADFSLLVSRAVNAVKSPADGSPIRIRIGVHSGKVMAGVVGNLMPRYCLFGDTVNTASRMESNGEAGRIHCSGDVAAILQASGKYVIEERGTIPIKGKGMMTTYWLERAAESNTNSNKLAIAKLEVMVQEILQSAEAENEEHGFSMDQGMDDDEEDEEEGGGGEGEFQTLLVEDGEEVVVVDVDEKSALTGEGGGPTAAAQNAGGSLASTKSKDGRGSSQRSASSKKLSRTASDGSSGRSSPMSPKARRHSHNPNKSTNPNALHSIRYQITQQLNNGGSSATGETTISSTGAKVLVVEDSPAQRKMLVKRLHVADPSWDISQAVSGEDALAKLQAARWRFDVVFVDENLSIDDGLFGHELVHLMRRQSAMSTSVIIACTSNPAKVSDQLLAAGVDYVWPKPPPLPGVIKPKIDQLLVQRIQAFAAEEALKSQSSQQLTNISEEVA